MKRYIIKIVCVATEKNINFKGVTKTYYQAKNTSYEDPKYIAFLAKHYGYTTKAAAMKAFKSAQNIAECETKNGYWCDTCELIEIEV